MAAYKLYLAFFALLALAEAKPRVLVVLDSWALKETHSSFFGQMNWKFDVTYEMASEVSPLINYDEPNYDHVLIMTPSTSVSPDSISEKNLLKFFDAGHDILIFGDQLTKKYTRNLLYNFGMEAYPQDNILSDSSRTEGITTSNVFKPVRKSISDPSSDIIFNGIGVSLDSKNDRAFQILQGSETSFATDSKVSDMGKDLTLVAGYQSRANTRFSFAGSIDMCSDKRIASQGSKSESSNYRFCEDLMQWTFQ